MPQHHPETGAPTLSPPLAALDAIARAVGPERVDEVWIFTPRRVGSTESTVIVAAAFEGDGDRRLVLTARCTIRRDEKGRVDLREEVTEHGAAPAERVGPIIDGVLARLQREAEPDLPRAVRIAGDSRRWSALRDSIAAHGQPD
jgi:hypothetical protein